MRVMVVEDSAHVRERLVGLLREVPGVDVVGEAGDAEQAIDMAAALRPDLVTLDLELASGSGFSVLRSTRASVPPPVVVILSNHASQSLRRRCLGAGADYFFDKSLEFDALTDTVAGLVAARPRP